MNYGKGLLALRSNRGLTQRQLAALVRLSPSYIAHIEAGRKKPSLDALEAICEGIGIPMHVLMLLSADQGELQDLSVEAAAKLGTHLQNILVGIANEPKSAT